MPKGGVKVPCTVTVGFVPGEIPTNRPMSDQRFTEAGAYEWRCSNGHVGTRVAKYSIAEGMANRHAKPGCVPVRVPEPV